MASVLIRHNTLTTRLSQLCDDYVICSSRTTESVAAAMLKDMTELMS